MKKKRKVNWTLIAIVCINIFSISFIKLYDQNKFIKTKRGIEKHRAYAVGTITLAPPPPGSLVKQGGSERIFYKYGNSCFEGDAVGPFERTKIGDKYIIMFDSTNLKRCVVLYDYPVSDSLWFIRDVAYLRKHPPRPYYESLIWKCFQDKEKLW